MIKPIAESSTEGVTRVVPTYLAQRALGFSESRGPMGMVEWLFTRPECRHRGIATALIAIGVADVRARGAGPVLIGADIEDTPKQMYLALGFEPVCLTREWMRT